MRRTLAGMLTLTQLQPLMGLVLCLGLRAPVAQATGEGCPMASAPVRSMHEMQVPGTEPTQRGIAASDQDSGPTDCPLATACVPLTRAVVVAGVIPHLVGPVSGVAVMSAIPAIDQPRLAPPTPPPNL